MTDFGEDMGMVLGVVESFPDLQVIPRGMDERYGVKPFTMVDITDAVKAFSDAKAADASFEEDKAPSSVEKKAPPNPLDQAYKKGYEAARAEFAGAQAELANRVDETLGYLNKALESTERGQDEQTLRLALLVAEKLARRALEQDSEALIVRAMETLGQDRDDAPLSLVADPKTAAILRGEVAKLRSSLQISAIEIEEDNRLAPGDLMLSRGAITLDARISTRLGRIQRALERELGLEIAEAGQ